MNKKDHIRMSKFLSLVLRHRPEAIGIELDASGWVEIDELLAACNQHGRPLTREQLESIVAECDKQRYAISEDKRRIRANQGHSRPVELGYAPEHPPDVLYHGTVDKFVGSILKQGLNKGKRHHVHLSPDTATAGKVGQRRGKPVILHIDAAAMHNDGYEFCCSKNGVWLTDFVPSKYISVRERDDES